MITETKKVKIEGEQQYGGLIKDLRDEAGFLSKHDYIELGRLRRYPCHVAVNLMLRAARILERLE